MTNRGGTKRSSWLIFRRRLSLIRTLLRGPHTREELIEVVNQDMQGEGYVGDAASALKHDLDALKDEYGCRVAYQRASKRYALEDMGDLALLDLPDTSLEALAFLEASFPEGAALPEHASIRDLLDRVLLLLPASRREEQRGRRAILSLQNTDSPASRIEPAVVAVVKRAILQRQELSFAYRSPRADGATIQHCVAPYEIVFRPEGHVYLDATLLEVIPRDPAAPIPSPVHYRLDRMVPGSLAILPTVLPPIRPQPPAYTLRYRLSPEVARRRDIATHFPSAVIDYHDDGSATVTAITTNLWQARQTLLRYGPACVVLEPLELVELFRSAIREMVASYAVTQADSGATDPPTGERP
ncbi:MAG TPA: WYL domain-containing protein [Chloroflexaceae bacterium]|nr:WYL domain-containing protein [Chloroflexaceae bacterium]